MNPRLIDDHVRELREAVLDVLHVSGPYDLRPIVLVRPPEHCLIHAVGLGNQICTEAEGVERLHRSARDAIGLPQMKRPRPTLNDPSRNPRKLRQLRGEDQPGWTGAHDQHVDLARHRGRSTIHDRISRPDPRIPDLKAAQVELHEGATLLPNRHSLSRRQNQRTIAYTTTEVSSPR